MLIACYTFSKVWASTNRWYGGLRAESGWRFRVGLQKLWWWCTVRYSGSRYGICRYSNMLDPNMVSVKNAFLQFSLIFYWRRLRVISDYSHRYSNAQWFWLVYKVSIWIDYFKRQYQFALSPMFSICMIGPWVFIFHMPVKLIKNLSVSPSHWGFLPIIWNGLTSLHNISIIQIGLTSSQQQDF